MGTTDGITIETGEADASIRLAAVRTPAGAIEIMGIVTLHDGVLTIEGARAGPVAGRL